MILKMKKNWKFLNLCGLSTESFLAIWPSQYKFLTNEFLMKKECVFHKMTIQGIDVKLRFFYLALENSQTAQMPPGKKPKKYSFGLELSDSVRL